MIKSLFLLATWVFLLFLSYKFVKLNITHIENQEKK
ncbi:Uncharacterised protein [Campylobacter geochelonis]|nr:Uncharacterised protein [Campylobacter geochelonis]